MNRLYERFTKILAVSGLLSPEDAARLPPDAHPVEWVVDHGQPEERVIEAVARTLKIGATTFADDRLDETLLKDLGGADALEARDVAPIESAGGPRLAMANPFDLPFLDRCQAILGRRPDLVFALPRTIRAQYERRRPPRLTGVSTACPACGGALVTIVYGRPEPGESSPEDSGCVYAGDLIPPDAPALHCRRCGRDYRTA